MRSGKRNVLNPMRMGLIEAVAMPGRLSPSSWPQYALVGSVAAACYLNGLGGEFVHDDVPAVLLNKDVVGSTRPLWAAFGDDFWGTPMTDSRSHKSYRPLTTLTFRTNYLLVGLDPFWFHGTNIFLHLVATIMFTKVCVKIARMSGPFTTLAGLMFAVHPIHTEAVTGIVGRADVLSCVFFLWSLLTYHDTTKRCNLWMSILSGALSILAKETGITIFLVNLLLDVYRGWHLKKTSDVRWIKEKGAFFRRSFILFMTFSVLIMLRLALLRGSLPKFTRGDNPAAFHSSVHIRFLTFSYIASVNFWLLLCPADLSHDWQMGSIPMVTTVSDPRNLLTVLVFVLILILCHTSFALRNQRKGEAKHSPETASALSSSSMFMLQASPGPKSTSDPTLMLGLTTLLIPFLPGSNLITTAGFVLAERVLYIPSMGFILLVVHGLQNIWRVWARHRQTLISLVCFMLIVHGLQCVARNRDWMTRESLLRAGMRTLPHNAKMHYNFANFLRDSGRLDLAKAHYHTAIRLWPTYASAYNNLGTLIKNVNEAEENFLLAIRYNQAHLNAHYNLGQLYRKQNRTLDAEKMLQRCIILSPNFTLGYVELVRLKELQNERNVASLLRTIVHQSTDVEYAMMYARHLQEKGNYHLALTYYYNALSDCNCKLEAFIGSAAILRRRGSLSRLFQLLTRYHAMQRLRRGDNSIQPNIYLQRWFLSYELEKHALDYNPGHWATDGASGVLFDGGKLTSDASLFRYRQNHRCMSAAPTTVENITIIANNCQQ